jgi:hypothetical protein
MESLAPPRKRRVASHGADAPAPLADALTLRAPAQVAAGPLAPALLAPALLAVAVAQRIGHTASHCRDTPRWHDSDPFAHEPSQPHPASHPSDADDERPRESRRASADTVPERRPRTRGSDSLRQPVARRSGRTRGPQIECAQAREGNQRNSGADPDRSTPSPPKHPRFLGARSQARSREARHAGYRTPNGQACAHTLEWSHRLFE